MTTLDILRGARDLLADESRWTRGAEARGPKLESGARPSCDPLDPGAERWCLVGAIVKVGGRDTPSTLVAMKRAADAAFDAHRRTLSGANDDAGHCAVLAPLDRAIADLEAA